MKKQDPKKLGKKNINSLLPGQTFNQYRIESIIGKGAMGIVYKAFDKRIQRYVALKILQANFIGEKERKQFLREVKAIANLNHSNIVQLFEVGTNPTYYFTMEYVEGETLGQVIANEKLSQQAIARIISKVAIGLYHAHIKGIVHGDIKPDNIMITKNREPKIMDFGLAKDRENLNNSQSGIQGTPAYLAPEQLEQGAIDKRVDIYALGITLYRSLTDTLPFNEKNYVSLFYQIMNEDPVKPRVINKLISTDLETICLKCIQKKADKRYTNAKFLARDLQNFLVGRPLQSGSSLYLSTYYKRFSMWKFEILSFLFSMYFLFVILQGSNDIFIIPSNKKIPLLLPWYIKDQEPLQKLELLSQYVKSEDVWSNEIRNSIKKQINPNQKNYNALWLSNLYEFAKLLIETKKKKEKSRSAYRFLEIIIESNDLSLIQNPQIKFIDICNIWLEKLNTPNPEYEKFQSAKRIYEFETGSKKVNNTKLIKEYLDKTTSAEYQFYISSNIGGGLKWTKEKNLLRAISLKPNFRFYSKLVEFYANNYLYSESIALSKKELQENPYSPLGHFNSARALIYLGDYNNALKHLLFLEKTFFNKQRERLFFQKIRLFVIQGNKNAAQKALKKARQCLDELYKEKASNNERGYQLWEQIVNNMGNKNFKFDLTVKNEEAARFLFKIKKIEKAYNFIDNFDKKNPFLKLAIYKEMLRPKKLDFITHANIWKEACEFAFGLLKKEPNKEISELSAIVYRYAYDFLANSNKVNQASLNVNVYLETLDELGQKLGNYYFVHFYKAKYYRCQNSYPQMIYHSTKVKELAPWYKKEIILEEKIALMRWNKSRNIDNSKFLANEIINEYKGNGPAHILLGSTHKNIQKAKNHFDQVNRQKLYLTDHLDFYFDRAILYEQQKMYDKAIDYMKIFIQFKPFDQASITIERCENAKLKLKKKKQ